MFIYHHVKAIREERFQKYIREKPRALRRSSHWELRDLLGALAARMRALGFVDGDREFPASPAY